jgi:hypothetical protein
MDQHLQPERPQEGAAPRPQPGADADSALARRRRFLLGGLGSVPLIVTLANRPALATGSQTCSISAALSGNMSRPMDNVCGDSPGCWKNHALSNNGAAWTRTGLSPNTPFASVFPMLNSNPDPYDTNPSNPPANQRWSVKPASGTMLQALNGTLIIEVELTDTSGKRRVSAEVDLLVTNAFQRHCAAAILNARYYGYPSFPLTPQQVLDKVTAMTTGTSSYGTFITDGSGATGTTNQGKLKTAISNITSQFDGYNNRGHACPAA